MQMSNRFKILIMRDCPGYVSLSLWMKDGDSWVRLFKSHELAYGLNLSDDYDMRVNHYRVTKDEVGDYVEGRKCYNTGYDDYMIFWVLEGREALDYCGRHGKVREATDVEAAFVVSQIAEGVSACPA